MAKAAWCTVTPTSGKETINVSATAHTGRIARSTSVLIQAANGTKPSANIAVNQAEAAVSTTMDATKPDVPAAGGVVTINGTSNSSKLSFITRATVFGISITNFGVVVVKVNNVAITKDVPIAGDPGAAAIYNFVATVTLTASPYAKDTVVTFELSDDTGAKKNCTFTWKAGASSLSVDKNALSLVSAGTAQAVNITSNDDWTVS